jgi:inorganic triphosphatase YgiF
VLIMKKYPQEGQSYAMETVYYDTPDSALSHRAYTLRRRMENDLSVCTLKVPSGTYGRGEFEVNCATIEEAIPELCKLSGIADLPALVAKGITPVCGAKFTRIAKTIAMPTFTAELALDSGILSGGGKEIPLCEIELELKDGKAEDLVAFAQTLANEYALTPELKSKFVRARALAMGE